MNRDKSADQRLELARQISQKEQRHDELTQEMRSIQNQLEHFQNQMEQGFRLEEEHYDTFREKSNNLGWESTAVQEIRKAVQRLTTNQSEQLEQDYRIENNRIQDEIESLHQERNALPWD